MDDQAIPFGAEESPRRDGDPAATLTERVRSLVQRSCAAVDGHDASTARHLQQIGVVSGVIARGMAADGVIDLRTAAWVEVLAPLHDLGKLAVPTQILRKPGRLDADEWAIVRRHPSDGRILATDLLGEVLAEDLSDATVPSEDPADPGATEASVDVGSTARLVVDLTANVVELHHETLDGRGYPYGLTDAEIPVEARIVAVADVFDALTATRAYKSAWSATDAVDELGRLVDSGRLDGRCVAVLEASTDELEEHLRGARPSGGV